MVVKHGDGDQISWNNDVSVGETGRTLIDSILSPAPSKRRPPPVPASGAALFSRCPWTIGLLSLSRELFFLSFFRVSRTT